MLRVVSAPARFTTTVAAIVCLGAFLDAQPASRLPALLELYLESPPQAVRLVASLPQADIERVMTPCAAQHSPNAEGGCDARQRLAAALLCTEAAAAVAGFSSQRARWLVAFATQMLKSPPAVSDDFMSRWYEFAAQLFLFEGLFFDASAVTEDGLRRFQDAAPLFLLRGTIAEVRLTSTLSDARGIAQSREQYPGVIRKGIDTAIADYRRALRSDPGLMRARLRLGWALLLARDTRASEELAGVVRDAADSSSRYLAQLFLGAIAEQAGRRTEALERYMAARQAVPDASSACLASSQVEAQLGRADRARSTAQECLALNKDRDPWWSFRFGEADPSALRALRMAVVSP